MGADPNITRGASRRHITRAAVEALARPARHRRPGRGALHASLGADGAGRGDAARARPGDLVRAGKVLHVGVSNWSAWQTALGLGSIADLRRHGWSRIDVIQPMYSLVKRQAEVEILPLAEHDPGPPFSAGGGLGVITYSPLAIGGGLLSGKIRARHAPGSSGAISAHSASLRSCLPGPRPPRRRPPLCRALWRGVGARDRRRLCCPGAAALRRPPRDAGGRLAAAGPPGHRHLPDHRRALGRAARARPALDALEALLLGLSRSRRATSSATPEMRAEIAALSPRIAPPPAATDRREDDRLEGWCPARRAGSSPSTSRDHVLWLGLGGRVGFHPGSRPASTALRDKGGRRARLVPQYSIVA